MNANFESDHSMHAKNVNCEECGKPICACLSLCDECAYDDHQDEIRFADPTGVSALRAASTRNPRNLPCPTCGQPDKLTPADRRAGYQCDDCANRAEGFGY